MSVNRPNKESPDKEIWEYIEYLESRLDILNKNGAVALASAMNVQMLRLAEEIENTPIGFANVTSKTFERFVSLLKISSDILKDYKLFTQEYGEVKEEEKKNPNLMEQFASKTKK